MARLNIIQLAKKRKGKRQDLLCCDCPGRESSPRLLGATTTQTLTPQRDDLTPNRQGLVKFILNK